MDKIDYLSQFDLLRSLSPEDLVEMDKLTSISPFPKKQLIQSPDTFTEKLYFIKKGKVRLYRLNAEGRQFTLDILKNDSAAARKGPAFAPSAFPSPIKKSPILSAHPAKRLR